MAGDLDEKFSELLANKNVVGAVILTCDGVPIKSSFDAHTTQSYADLSHKLVKSNRELVQANDASNDLKFFRMTTKKHEIMVSPDPQYTLVVIHHPHEERG